MSTKKQRDDTNDRIDIAHHYDIDYSQRVIYLTGVEEEGENDPGVEYRQANRFIRNINILSSIDHEKPVLVILKNPGGYCDEGMAIYDAIKSAPMPITILGYGCVASMATIILQSANKRVVMPSVNFMIHMGYTSAFGTPKQVMAEIEYSKIFWEMMITTYVDAMKNAPHGKARNWSRKRIREWLTDQMNRKEDVWMTAEEAVDWGFADDVFTGWPSLLTYTDEQLER